MDNLAQNTDYFKETLNLREKFEKNELLSWIISDFNNSKDSCKIHLLDYKSFVVELTDERRNYIVENTTESGMDTFDVYKCAKIYKNGRREYEKMNLVWQFQNSREYFVKEFFQKFKYTIFYVEKKEPNVGLNPGNICKYSDESKSGLMFLENKILFFESISDYVAKLPTNVYLRKCKFKIKEDENEVSVILDKYKISYELRKEKSFVIFREYYLKTWTISNIYCNHEKKTGFISDCVFAILNKISQKEDGEHDWNKSENVPKSYDELTLIQQLYRVLKK